MKSLPSDTLLKIRMPESGNDTPQGRLVQYLALGFPVPT